MKILFGNSPITLLDSLFITVVSMAIVFFVLILISFILSLFKYIPSKEEPGTSKKQVNKPAANISGAGNQGSFGKDLYEGRKMTPEDIKDEKMLAAISVAVIEAAGETENAYIRVRSIKEIC